MQECSNSNSSFQECFLPSDVIDPCLTILHERFSMPNKTRSRQNTEEHSFNSRGLSVTQLFLRGRLRAEESFSQLPRNKGELFMQMAVVTLRFNIWTNRSTEIFHEGSFPQHSLQGSGGALPRRQEQAVSKQSRFSSGAGRSCSFRSGFNNPAGVFYESVS